MLEVGCGVGAQTLTVAERSPGASLTAIDLSAESLAAARKRAYDAGLTDIAFAQADVYTLPRADGPLAAGTFDHVFVCFLLEHLPRPVEALRRLRAMLRPGGTITVIEGDHGLICFHPDSPAARDAIACQVALQRNAGGDALLGRRLHPLLTEGGFRDVSVSPRMVYVDGSDPGRADRFIRKTFTAMIEGIREPAVAGGLTTAEHFDAGIRDLLRTAEPDGVFCYTFFKATGKRQGRRRVGRVEGLDHEFRRGDVESGAEGGDHVQEPELAAAGPDVQGDEYPVGRAGRPDARRGYSWIAAHFIGECRYCRDLRRPGPDDRCAAAGRRSTQRD